MLDLYINIRTSDARFRKPLSFVVIATVIAIGTTPGTTVGTTVGTTIRKKVLK